MHEQTIRQIRFRIGALMALKGSVIGLTAWVFLWGTFVVAWRVAMRETPEWLIWGAWAAPAIVLAAGYLAWRRVPSATAVRALVDRHSACGGMLMAAEEQTLGSWERRMPTPADLRVSWQGKGPLLAFLSAVVFLLASFLFPQRLATWADPGLEIGSDVQKLASTLDMLKDEKILEQAKVDFLKDKLKQIQDDASGKNPKKTFDALDHVRDSLSRTAQQAAEGAVDKSKKASKAQKLAEAVRQNFGSLDPSLQKGALEELASLVEKALDENDFADQKLDPEFLKQLQDIKLSPEQLKKLADAMKGVRGGLSKKLGKLTKARLIDPSMVKECDGECECEGECTCEDCMCDETTEGDCKCTKCKGGKARLAKMLAKRGGRGGLTEGPGHNEMSWTEGTKEEGAKFKEQALPPGQLANLKESIKVGVGKTQPKEGDIAPSQGGAITNSAVGGGSANANVVLPQHRSTVERFFMRPKQ